METPKVCRGCFTEWGGQAVGCIRCGWDVSSMDSDNKGWKTGMVLDRRYLLGRIYLRWPDCVIWRVYDRMMDARLFFLVSMEDRPEILPAIAWGWLTQKEKADCPVVLSLKETAGRLVLAFSLRDYFLSPKELISWIQPQEESPEQVVSHIEYTGSSPGMKNALAGDTLLDGRYRVAGCIGIGGFGITYLCEDILIQRNVAVKEYFPEAWADREGREVAVRSSGVLDAYRSGMNSFMKEIKITAAFLHERHLVTIYDAFRENDTVYMVMEYLSGVSIGKEIKNGERQQYTPQEMAETILPVLEALETVHGRKIIHGDISPENILRTADGEIVLIDFGAAKYNIENQPVLNTVFLKRNYAAPEQYRTAKEGIPADEGPWTDLYAVGAVMYYLLTGHKPLDALTRMSRKTSDLIPPKKYKVRLKKDWMVLIRQCMEPEPFRRMSSARQVGEQIRELLKRDNK